MASSSFLIAFLLLVAHVNAHMWLRTPVSQGGLTFAGGTGGPCAGRTPGSGERTIYETGQTATFQFRVNQHGPGPFKFALATTGTTFDSVIKENIANTVTAGADGFDGVNVAVTIPSTPCDTCVIQLSGMGQNDGTGKWYNCADVKIIPDGSRQIPKPATLSPASGSTSGSTSISVTGTGFGNGTVASLYKCKFDDVVVPATFVSNTQLTCVSPPRNQPGTAALEVSIDGATYSSTGTVYTFTGEVILPRITKISPTSGRTGTTITITGENFYSEAMLCRFGNHTSKANVISETEATCVVPTLGGDFATVKFEVSVDNSPYSQSGKTFKVTAFTDSSAGLSGGAVAGVVIGVLVIVGIVGAVGFLAYSGKIKLPGITPPTIGKSRV